MTLCLRVSAAAFLIVVLIVGLGVGLGVAGDGCGVASFYGKAHQGKRMANGEPFNRHALTAASWHYPLGTRLIVRNVQNGHSVQIVVTDRGPAKRLHRLIDLSEAAFARLANTSQGIIKRVCVSRL